MAPLKSTRLAWSVAIASLALWATSAPITWGQVAAGAARFFDDTPIEQTNDAAGTANDPNALNLPCPPIPAGVIAVSPSSPQTPPPPPGSAQDGTFSLCPSGDQQATASAIEQLIAGRGFSASLSSNGTGCAQLTIRVTSQSTSGSASSQLNVGLGSGQTLSLRIVSERGVTHVSIGQGQ